MFMLYIRLISFGVKISEENLKVFLFLNFIESWLKSKQKKEEENLKTKVLMTKSDEKKEIYSFSKSDFLTKISFTLNQICDAKKSQLNTSVFYLM